MTDSAVREVGAGARMFEFDTVENKARARSRVRDRMPRRAYGSTGSHLARHRRIGGMGRNVKQAAVKTGGAPRLEAA